MSLSARSVSAVLAFHVTSALTLILPACVPAPAVVTVILLLAKALFNVPTLIMLSFWLGVNVLAALLLPACAWLEIVTLKGSINHSPVLPLSESVDTFVLS